MAILVAGINQDPSPHIPTLDNVDDLGNDTRGFRALYGSNAGQSVLYGDLAGRGILGTLQLATPATPTLTVVGTAGVTTYGYRVVATVLGGDGTSLYTARSTEATIATGNAALDANNYVRIDWTSVPGATGYRIYRTTGGATQGLIATITNGNTITLNDTGLAGGGESTPTTNITGEFNLAGLASLRATANGTDVALDKIATAGILYLWNRTDGKGLQIEFANNALVFSATAWAIRAAAADASTLLFQAQNAAGQTQTVLTIVGAATVANSYITAQVGGTWTLASGQTWTLPAFTANAQCTFDVGLVTGNNIFFTGAHGIYSQSSNTGTLKIYARNGAGSAQEIARSISSATIANGIFALYAQAAVPTLDGAGNTAILPAGFLWFKFNAGGTLVAYVNDAGAIKSLSLGSPA